MEWQAGDSGRPAPGQAADARRLNVGRALGDGQPAFDIRSLATGERAQQRGVHACEGGILAVEGGRWRRPNG